MSLEILGSRERKKKQLFEIFGSDADSRENSPDSSVRSPINKNKKRYVLVLLDGHINQFSVSFLFDIFHQSGEEKDLKEDHQEKVVDMNNVIRLYSHIRDIPVANYTL